VERDFAPISPWFDCPIFWSSATSCRFNSVPELIAYSRANDGKINYGSGGNGTSSHLCASCSRAPSAAR